MFAIRIASGLTAAVLALGMTACASAEGSSDTDAPAPTSAASDAQAPVEEFQAILQEELPNVKGKSFTSAIVTFPPRGEALPHRHGEAFVFAYVLEGTVRSQVDDGPFTTYKQGEIWTEPPGAHHVATANASATEPAKLLVAFVADTGAELKVDDTHY